MSMMIGTLRPSGASAQDSADFDAAQDGKVEVEDDEIGRPGGHSLERGVAAADDFDVRVTAPFERVLDEAGDILLVFDDEDPVFLHPVRHPQYRRHVSLSYRSC